MIANIFIDKCVLLLNSKLNKPISQFDPAKPSLHKHAPLTQSPPLSQDSCEHDTKTRRKHCSLNLFDCF